MLIVTINLLTLQLNVVTSTYSIALLFTSSIIGIVVIDLLSLFPLHHHYRHNQHVIIPIPIISGIVVIHNLSLFHHYEWHCYKCALYSHYIIIATIAINLFQCLQKQMATSKNHSILINFNIHIQINL
jgi:hypothetical protein